MTTRARPLLAALIGIAALACAAAADDPGEQLKDPAREARARAMFRQVRCVVCQSESIDESEADLAHDLRRAIRAQIAAGRSDADIRGYLLARYGSFILMKPPFSPATAILWLLPFGALALGGGWLMLQSRKTQNAEDDLSAADEQRVAALLGPDGNGHGFAATPPQESAEGEQRVT